MTEVPHVYACIAAVSAEIATTGIAKSRNNLQQGYKFRGIDDVYNAIAPLLAKHGLVIIPRILTRELVERAARSGGVLYNVTVEAEFDFVSSKDGSKVTARSFGEAMDSADKATNKAMSAAYKYTAFQTFCIPTEGDNDADAATPELATSVSRASVATADESLPAGYHRIAEYRPDGDWHHITWGLDAQGGAVVYKTRLVKIANQARQAYNDQVPVKLRCKRFPFLDDVEPLDGLMKPVEPSAPKWTAEQLAEQGF